MRLYRGLGDRVFAMVFRRIYGEEVSVEEIDDDFKRELTAPKGRLSVASEDSAAMLDEAGVLVLDPAKLDDFEPYKASSSS